MRLRTTTVPEHTVNDDKTSALAATCSAMLSLALFIRVIMMYCLHHHLYRQSKVCGFTLKALYHVMDVGVYIILWYGISIGMTLFNKWFLRVWCDGGYPFATTMTCINMLTKCLLSRIINRWCSNHPMTSLSRSTYWKLAIPIGICTSLDIMLSNLSLFYITVTFYTIVKSGGNVWNLFFSIWLGHQRASYALCLVIILICLGLGLASFGTTTFVLDGFLLVLAASIIGTLRWVLTQSLLVEMEETRNPTLGVVYYISPASAIALFPIVLIKESKDLMHSKFVTDPSLCLQSIMYICISGCLAFGLIFVEITLVKKTSALSLGIAGSFKDVTQVMLAVFTFGDPLSGINVLGLVIATIGMLLYTLLKYERNAYVHVPTISESPIATHIPVLKDIELVRRESKGHEDDETDQVLHV